VLKNLTTYEIDTLPHHFNLTDGHAFRPWTAEEETIIDHAACLFRNNTRQKQASIEREYIQDFLALGRQTWREDVNGFLMCFTASMAFEIVANYLRLDHRSVTLIEPAFDNLADIFLRHRIPLQAYPDSNLEADPEAFRASLTEVTGDAICLVNPNNPTGRMLSEQNLRILAGFCKEHNKLLILDACFRAYVPRNLVFDQYKILQDADIDYIIVEDTGKTWPTAEIKAPFFAASRARGLFQSLYDIYTDFLLHVSPVGIKLMHEFIRLSLRDDMASIQGLVETNREMLTANLAGTFLTPCQHPFMSVAWLRIDHPLTGAELKTILDSQRVFVLAGDHFYWSDHRKGEKYIRVALTRDPETFAAASSLLGQVCRDLSAIPISVNRDARREIAERGFAWIPGDAWSIAPALQAHWQQMQPDWDQLELDPYLKDGATFRERRYGRFCWSPEDDVLLPLDLEPYFQPEQENAYAGGISREFATLLAATVNNPFLHALIRFTFAQLPLTPEKYRQKWEVRVHQIRIVASADQPGQPAPEGIHQDGTDFLTLHLVARRNVNGAETTIYDLQRKPLASFTFRENLDSFILEDPRILHGVTPVYPADPQERASRDLLGIDFICNPERK
jgi:aspartate/methionine/tyrosine aminotransferase